MKTWHLEAGAVAAALAAVTTLGTASGWRDWLAAGAVLLTFCHGQIAERLREADTARVTPAVACSPWLSRYFVAKENLWFAYFLSSGAYAPLAGCLIFAAYPLWRRWWRQRQSQPKQCVREGCLAKARSGGTLCPAHYAMLCQKCGCRMCICSLNKPK